MSGAILAEKLGVIRNTVSRWERGEIIPSMERLSSIAIALDTTLAYLLGENAAADIKPITNNTMLVMVYDMREITSYDDTNISGITGMRGSGEIFVPERLLGVIDNNRPPFAIIMPNDSMRGANMNENDSVVVNPSEQVNNGDPALVIYNGAPMLRWVCYKSNGNIELQPANPNHRVAIVDAPESQDQNIFTIVGRAVVAMAQKDLKSAF